MFCNQTTMETEKKDADKKQQEETDKNKRDDEAESARKNTIMGRILG